MLPIVGILSIKLRVLMLTIVRNIGNTNDKHVGKANFCGPNDLTIKLLTITECHIE